MRMPLRLFVMLALMPVSSFAQTIQVRLDPQTAYRAPGGQIRFEMVVTQPDGTVAQRNAASQWKSSSPAVASVDNSGAQAAGTVTAIMPGTTTISATIRNLDGIVRTASATLVVRAYEYALTPQNATLLLGGPNAKGTYVGTVTRPDGTKGNVVPTTAQWSSSNPSVLTIDAAGTATGVVAGNATITSRFQTADGVMRTATAAVKVASFEYAIAPLNTIVAIGGPAQFVGTVTRPDATKLTVIPTAAQWSSSNPGIAAVDAAGKATGVAPGTAVITSRFQTQDGVMRTATANVQVGTFELTLQPAVLGLGMPNEPPLTARVTRPDGSVSTVPPAQAQWSSSNPSAAIVYPDGRVKGVSPGVANIRVRFQTADGVLRTATSEVKVWQVVLEPVRFVRPGATQQMNVTVYGPDGNIGPLAPANMPAWSSQFSSADPGKATISNTGAVTGVSLGQTTLTYRGIVGGTPIIVSSTTPLVVSNGYELLVQPSSIVTPAAVPGVTAGTNPAQGQILLWLKQLDGTETSVFGQWISSNTELATINQNGQWTTSGNPAFRGNLTFTVTYRMPDLEVRTVNVPVRIE